MEWCLAINGVFAGICLTVHFPLGTPVTPSYLAKHTPPCETLLRYRKLATSSISKRLQKVPGNK
jgi:hypothetical protein